MTATASAGAAGRPDVDLRPLLPPTVPAQGHRPLCLPFALTGAHDALRHADGVPFAPEAVWWRCAGLGQTTPQGVLLDHAGDALADVGQPAAAAWRYNPALGYGTEEPPAACGTPPWRQATWREVPLAHDGVEDAVEDLLAVSRPVVLVIEVTDQFERPHPDGHVDVPPIVTPAGDYHAVLAVGAATDPVRGRRLLVRNSWGLTWAAGGYAWLPLAYLIAFAAQAAVVS